MAMMANNPNDFAFKWHAADGNDATRYATILEQNKARIEELKTELAQLEDASANDLTDMDILDLELAANRANAYDMNGATTAIGRIDSRVANRAKERLDASRAQQNKDYENYTKLSDLQAKHRELGANLTQAKTKAQAEVYRAQMENLAKQIKALGGEAEGHDAPITSYAEVMRDYWDRTKNTKNGRVFLDDVTGSERFAIVQGLREIGEFQLADQLEATPTKGEQDDAKKKESVKKAKIKKAVKAVKAQLDANKYRTDPEGIQLYKQAEAMADSLFRNYPSYVQLQNHYPVYKAKD